MVPYLYVCRCMPTMIGMEAWPKGLMLSVLLKAFAGLQ